jgi:O-antigen ligase
MSVYRPAVSLEQAAAALLATCVVFFSLGSSSVSWLRSAGQDLRWPALLALWLVAVWLAVQRRGLVARGLVAAIVWLAGVLLGLMLISAAWSSEPRLSFERAVSFAILLTATGALAVAAAARPRLARLLLAGIVAGVALVLAAGFLLLLVHPSSAEQTRSTLAPWRFRGLGENPNTVSMLASMTMPLMLWALLESEGRRRRAAAATFVLAYATIVLSASRGALLAALLGTLALSLLWPRQVALRIAGVATAAFVLGVAVAQIPQAATPPVVSGVSVRTTSTGTTTVQTTTTTGTGTGTGTTPTGATGPTASGQLPLPAVARGTARLEDESGPLARRTLFGSSGRAQAWQGAIEQGNEAPLLGYGFGTEDDVFVDHFAAFQGRRPENSLIGLYLQLGVIGLALFVSLGLALLASGVRALGALARRERLLLGACLGAVAGGIVLMLFQSYVYAAGNLSAASFWTCALLLAAAGSWARTRA